MGRGQLASLITTERDNTLTFAGKRRSLEFCIFLSLKPEGRGAEGTYYVERCLQFSYCAMINGITREGDTYVSNGKVVDVDEFVFEDEESESEE